MERTLSGSCFFNQKGKKRKEPKHETFEDSFNPLACCAHCFWCWQRGTDAELGRNPGCFRRHHQGWLVAHPLQGNKGMDDRRVLHRRLDFIYRSTPKGGSEQSEGDGGQNH